MKLNQLKKILFATLFASFVLAGNLFAQTNEGEDKQINFPYSQNPKTKSAKKDTENKQADEAPKRVADKKDKPRNTEVDDSKPEETDKSNKTIDSDIEDKTTSEVNLEETSAKNAKEEKTVNEDTKEEKTKSPKKNLENAESKKLEIAKAQKEPETKDEATIPVEFKSRSVANETLEVAKRGSKKAISPTEIYKVGVGDILFISLQNAPPNVSTYFTVLNNGTIDYPLAGGMSFVLGLTPDEIEAELRKKIKLYENPQISVKVREHSSHSITVLGLVENPGIKYLQREAVPLYVIRAEAIAQSRANQVAIRRAENDETEQYSLVDSKNDEVLIFPGDIVEFSSILPKEVAAEVPQFYYIGGNIRTVGQMDFHQGITLTQAILASGGLTKAKVRNVTIRRKNDKGLLIPIVYDLTKIKDGKIPDPLLQSGDTIEVEN